MPRRVFFSFHHKVDSWRTAQIRSAGMIENGGRDLSDNDWEAVKRGGDAAIQRWIDGQMSGTSCTIVLIGNQTAGRRWIKHEIEKTWSDRKGLVGVYIHNLRDSNQMQARKGVNPFAEYTLGTDKRPFADIVRAYDPPFTDSKQAYDYITSHLASWVEEAISIRSRY